MSRSPRPNQPRRQRGASMLECLIVTTVATLLTGGAVTGYDEARRIRHLEGAASQLRTDVLLVRSLAVVQNRGLRMGFGAGAAGSCYVIHSGPARACTCSGDGQTQCQAGAQLLRSVHLPASLPAQLQSNVSSILFDADLGTSTPTGTLRLSLPNGAALHQVVNIMGRVRSCSPAPALRGYAAC